LIIIFKKIIKKRKFDQNLYSNKKIRHSSSSIENFKYEKNSLDHQPIKHRNHSNERLQKQSITPIIKNIPLVKKSSSENGKLDVVLPSQGLLLCPKEDPTKKKKKKKIAPTNTALLDDDPVLDSILFNEMQSIQQQWQQFLILTMEKELHTNPSDGKKKSKINKFNRTNEFLLSYENLYNFEGMKHWYPVSR